MLFISIKYNYQLELTSIAFALLSSEYQVMVMIAHVSLRNIINQKSISISKWI
jgi:hypothetical protein